MTGSILPSNGLVEILRLRLAESARRAEGNPTSSTGRADSADKTPGRGTTASLRQAVTTRLERISPDDPNRATKRRRIFLETVLAREFGTALLDDPAFQETLDQLEDVAATELGIDGFLDTL